jgi:hypothetical protein
MHAVEQLQDIDISYTKYIFLLKFNEQNLKGLQISAVVVIMLYIIFK